MIFSAVFFLGLVDLVTSSGTLYERVSGDQGESVIPFKWFHQCNLKKDCQFVGVPVSNVVGKAYLAVTLQELQSINSKLRIWQKVPKEEQNEEPNEEPEEEPEKEPSAEEMEDSTQKPSTQTTQPTAKATTNAGCSVKNCDTRCGTPHGTGVCRSDGRCLCWWGWTGPNAKYLPTNRIAADFCTTACTYSHVYKSAQCAAADDNCP